MSSELSIDLWRGPENNLVQALRPPVFLIAEHNGRKVTIPRNADYQITVASIKKIFHSFKKVPNGRIAILAHFEEVNDHVEVTEDLWPAILPSLKAVRIELNNEPVSSDLSDGCTGGSHQLPSPSLYAEGYRVPGYLNRSLVNNTIGRAQGTKIFVVTSNGSQLTYTVDLAIHTTEDLKYMIQEREGIHVYDQLLTLTGRLLNDKMKLVHSGIKYGSEIQLDEKLSLAGKPVIYLFPPNHTTNVQVELSLHQSWTFTGIYPPTAVTTTTKDNMPGRESISWVVDAHPDGILWDHATKREITYLFWEAHPNRKTLRSPPLTRSSSPVEGPSPSHTFDPASPVVLPGHSAVLSFNKVTGYIDDVLLALGLHAEARTSFITYWLPDLSKHAFIALRFLPQHEYEKAAPLNISPAPQVVSRVFMLFRGVEESRIGLWNDAVDMAQKDVSMWRDIVGVDVDRVHDKSLFRVLEWGGMEVWR
ncbi:hypothetical protein RSOLAG22IIIB_09288 [Rhizoctonia solani]|uniref:Ubiquitin-like domain-containing protein n=1 Tax=Rhizoctonia solani TaxID=456999 RepID=A0A0K6FXK9_9AGAM|nr:hypothetical protein RSOLAG22IIIB_09288 [Rhizoctonia solani]